MKTNCLYDALINVKELKSHPKNRNSHPDEQIKRLASILSYQGWRYPVKVSKQSGFITSGHGRVLAAKLNGWKTAPVNYQDYESDEQEYADVQADNAIASWAELDLSGINSDIGELGPDFDLDLLGIKDFVLEPAELVPQCDEDEVPEHVEPQTKPGDLYRLGNHRLLCGDSTDIGMVERLMDGQRADMVFTDPPYGMNLDTNYDGMYAFGDHSDTGNRFKKVKGDDIEYDPNPILAIDSKRKFIWGADYFYDKLPKGGCFIAWDKRSETLDRVPGNTTEFCWAYPPTRRTSVRIIWSGYYGMTGDDAGKRMHPTQKPIKLVEWFLEAWGKETKTVVDIYGGSGSTLIACEKTNRKCFMMELDPHYCSIIIERWCKYSGKEAYLVNDDGTQTSWTEIKNQNRT